MPFNKYIYEGVEELWEFERLIRMSAFVSCLLYFKQ